MTLNGVPCMAGLFDVAREIRKLDAKPARTTKHRRQKPLGCWVGIAIGGFDPFSSPSWQRSNSCQIGFPGPLPRPPIDCEGPPPPGSVSHGSSSWADGMSSSAHFLCARLSQVGQLKSTARSSRPQPRSPRSERRNTSGQNRSMPEKRSVGGYLSPSLSSCDAGFLADLLVDT